MCSEFWKWIIANKNTCSSIYTSQNMCNRQAYGSTLSPLTTKLARLGSSGKYPGNVERDLHRALELPIPVYWVEAPVRSLVDRRSVETAWLPMLLPHQIYHYLFDALLIHQVSKRLPLTLLFHYNGILAQVVFFLLVLHNVRNPRS